jgi:hypothetical protein
VVAPVTPEQWETMTEQLAAGRRHVALMARDLAWLSGAADQAGVSVPEGITVRLTDAVDWLAGPA